MAYDRKKIFEQAKKAITEKKLIFIEDIVGWLPCGKTAFYEMFPVNSDEVNELREMLEVNKIQIKSSIRSKLYKSEKAGELLALYRLVCTPDERRMLNQQYIESRTTVTGGLNLVAPSEAEAEIIKRLNDRNATDSENS